ncbi:succinate--CoA ligase subunit alpha [archaeon]|nr:succinate--CoA ligase subunit alpha [archaeon]
MAILVGKETRVVVQGITGREGRFHTKLMLEYGTKVVSGVRPGKGGEEVWGVPVFDTVQEAVEQTGANASIVFVPAAAAKDAVLEAIDAGVPLIVVITEGIPKLDAIDMVREAQRKGIRIIGPNTPGVISPGKCKLGIMPAFAYTEGCVGIISRSGTLSYEIAYDISSQGLGVSTSVGIGGDAIIGTSIVECLELFRDDDETEAVVIIGEIGGDEEERAAEYIARTQYPKPVFAYIAGRSAPPGKRMGHSGAIISGGYGTAESKERALRKAGVIVVDNPYMLGKVVKDRLRR